MNVFICHKHTADRDHTHVIFTLQYHSLSRQCALCTPRWAEEQWQTQRALVSKGPVRVTQAAQVFF